VAVTSIAERRELRESTRAFLAHTYPELSTESRVRHEDGLDEAFWARMATEVALQGLLVPERYGGLGLVAIEAVVVAEEAGRVLLAQPLVSSALLATLAVSHFDNPLLPRLASGTAIAVLVLDPEVELRAVGDNYMINGTAPFVLDGMFATDFLVATRDCVFAVESEHVDRQEVQGIDLTRGFATVRFSDSLAQFVGNAPVDRLRDLAAVLASAELVGLADCALTRALDYAGQREQFGRMIGSFQSIKHLCADMFTAVESSRAIVAAAALAAGDDDPSQLGELASVAKAYCSEQCPRVIESLVQILGGVGFTWENPAHLLLRRAKALEVLFGDPGWHRAHLAALLKLGPPVQPVL
jgi:alkylation response protein AidB-like acyl-CoA dehydrogenase